MGELDATPVVSVVVPTYNRRGRLERVLAALEAQNFDEPYELVVVSDGSTDGTEEFLQRRRSIVPTQVVVQENQGPAAARNNGVDAARGELIVFVDDDVVAHRDLLRTHFTAHAEDLELVAIGPMTAPGDHEMSPWTAWEQAMLDRQYMAMTSGAWAPTGRQFYTGNASVRRSHLLAAGGFDPSFRRAEDVELAYRLSASGLRFRFCPDAIGFHYAERSYDSWRRAAYLYGCNDVILARDRGQEWVYSSIQTKASGYRQPAGWVVKYAATRPRFASLLSVAAGRLAFVAHALRCRRLARVMLSGVYAVEYYRGVADELPSKEALAALIESGRPAG